MSYVENHLLKDEKVLYRAHVHSIIFLWPAIWTVLTFILLSQDSFLKLLAFISAILAISRFSAAIIQYVSSEYALTNKRVIVKLGLIKRHSIEIFLRKVEGIKVHQGLWGRLIDYGTITIIGTGGSKEPFHDIQAPLQFRAKVHEEAEKLYQENVFIDETTVLEDIYVD